VDKLTLVFVSAPEAVLLPVFFRQTVLGNMVIETDFERLRIAPGKNRL
jgi:hypothetical protein